MFLFTIRLKILAILVLELYQLMHVALDGLYLKDSTTL